METEPSATHRIVLPARNGNRRSATAPSRPTHRSARSISAGVPGKGLSLTGFDWVRLCYTPRPFRVWTLRTTKTAQRGPCEGR